MADDVALRASIALDLAELKRSTADAQKAFGDIRKAAQASGAGIDTEMKAAIKGATSSFADLRVASAKSIGDVSTLLTQAGVNVGAFGQVVGALASPFGIAAAAAVGLGLAIHTTTDFMVKNYEQMRGLIAVSGLEAEAADTLADTFDLLGFNVEALRNAMFKMASEVDSGGKNFRRLGVDLRDSSGNLKVEGELFLEVRDRISAMGSASERNAALMDVFGRSGRELAAVFALSAEEFGQWLEKAGKMGPSAAESMRVTREYTLATAEFSKTWDGFVESVGQKILPAMSSMTQSLTLAVEEVASWGQRTSDWIDDLIVKWNNYRVASQAALPGDSPDRGHIQISQRDLRGMAASEAGMFAGIKPDEIAASVRTLLKGEQEAFTKLNEMARLAGLPEAARAIEVLRKQVEGLAEDAGLAKPAADALADSIIRMERAKQSADAIKPLISAMDNLTQFVAGLKLTETELEFRKLVAPIESVIKAMEAAGTIAPATAARYRVLAAATAQVAVDHRLADEALKKFVATMNSDLDTAMQKEIQGWDHDALAMRDAAEALQAFTDAQDVLMAGLDGSGDAFDALTASIRQGLIAETIKLENEQAGLTAAIGLGGAAADLARESYLRFGKAFSDLGEREQTAVTRFVTLKRELADATAAQAFENTLNGINIQAQLLGPTFDRLSPTIAAVTGELVRLGTESQGVVTPAIEQLQARLESLRQFESLRDMFKGVFESIGQSVNTLVEGVLLGTQTMAQAWDKLWKSIAIGLVNSGLQRLIKGVGDGLWNLVAGALSANGSSQALAANGQPVAGNVLSPGAFGQGGGFNIPTGVFDPSVWSSISSSLSGLYTFASSGGATLGPAFTGVTSVDVLLSGGGISDALGMLGGAASGLSTALAGVGAAVAAFGSIMDIVNDNMEAGIGGLVGGVALGVVGAYFAGPFGAALGYGIGDLLGSWIGGMFGGPSNYDITRIQAADEANAALGNVAGGYQVALQSGNLAQVLAALSTGAGGSGNSVRSELVLPSGLASQLGIVGQQIGDQLVAQWSTLTLDQFAQVMAAFKEQPGLLAGIRGSGDVPYLAPGDAQAIADQVAQGAQALLSAFLEMDKAKDRITQLAVDLTAAAAQVLPADLADQFAARIDPIRDRMLAVLSSGLGVDEMQAQLTALAAEMQAYVGLVSLYGTIEQDQAKMAGDIATQTRGAILAITSALDAADKAVKDAQARALGAVSPAESLAAEADLRDVILKRYQMQLDMEAQIQAAMTGLLNNVAKPLTDTLTGLAVMDLRSTATHTPDPAAFNELYASLVTMAETAPTAAERLFAISQGLAAVIAAIPTSATYFANGTGLYAAGASAVDGSIPVQIWNTLVTQTAPFMDQLAGMIGDALTGNDLQGALGLLQQQAQAIQAVASAGIAAINEWMTTALSDLSAQADLARDDINANWDAVIAATNAAADAEVSAIEQARDLRVAALTDEIEMTQAAAKAQQEAIAAQITGLQSAMQAAQEWASATASLGDFIAGLKFQGLAPEDQLTFAQGAFDALLAQFEATPASAMLGDIQQAAQQLLSVGAGDPDLLARVIASLEDVQQQAATAAGPVTSDQFATRIAKLQSESERIGKAADTQVALLRQQITAAQGNATDQIAAINAARTAAIDQANISRQHDLDLVNDWEAAQEKAIRQTAQTQIDNIKSGMADALRDNAKAQNEIYKPLMEAQKLALEAVRDYQADTVRLLGDIKERLGTKLGTTLQGIVNPGPMKPPGGPPSPDKTVPGEDMLSGNTQSGVTPYWISQGEISDYRARVSAAAGGGAYGQWLGEHMFYDPIRGSFRFDLGGDAMMLPSEGIGAAEAPAGTFRARGGSGRVRRADSGGGTMVQVAPQTYTLRLANGKVLADLVLDEWVATENAHGTKPIPGELIRPAVNRS